MLNSEIAQAINASKNKIFSSFAESPDLVFLNAGGNLGNHLTSEGARSLLRESGHPYREINLASLGSETGHTALVCGSGDWSKISQRIPTLLPKITSQFNQVIVLPSTYIATEPFIYNTITSHNALYFARERVSYESIGTLCRAELAHDCAFYFNFEPYQQNGSGILNAFRTDVASIWKQLPDGNNDISLTCSSLEDWLKCIALYEIVRTDRAHVLIAAAMLGKQVEYTSTFDHKVPAIADYALQELSVTRITDPFAGPNSLQKRPFFSNNRKKLSLPALVKDQQLLNFADALAQRLETRLVVLDDLANLPATPGPQATTDNLQGLIPDQLQEALYLIPNGLKNLRKNPERAGALRDLALTNPHLLLVDDLTSFLSLDLLQQTVKQFDLPLEFCGYTSDACGQRKFMSVLSRSLPNRTSATPAGFRVVAIISAYNEADIIAAVIDQLIAEDVEVYVIDNWSTDETLAIVQAKAGHGLLGWERWPSDAPSNTYNWGELLRRKEELSFALQADWFIHADADEIRRSPWTGIKLRDALYFVESSGYNTIEFTHLLFRPVNNNYRADLPLEEQFQYFEFGTQPGHFQQNKAWKKQAERVNLVETGGHSVGFAGKKMYPWNFLMMHYPIRSQAHGEQKIFRDRAARWNQAERAAGWHQQYNHASDDNQLLHNPRRLLCYDGEFKVNYLMERLLVAAVRQAGNLTGQNDSPQGAVPSPQGAVPSEEMEDMARELKSLKSRLDEQSQALAIATAELTQMKNSRAMRAITMLKRFIPRALLNKIVKA